MKSRFPSYDVTTLNINFKEHTFTRKRKKVNRWILYRMAKKFRTGIPVEYMALQYDIPVGLVWETIEFMLKNSKQVKLRDYSSPIGMFAESFQFFYWLGTPVHIMARLYRTTPDAIVNAMKNERFKSRMFWWTLRSRYLYREKAGWWYKDTPEGKLMYKKVKEMIKWRE